MKVEIHGAGFQNKGAELMLRTTIKELQARVDNFVPVIDPEYGSYESRCDLKLKQIVPNRGHVGRPLHTKKLNRQKLYSKIKIDSLLKKTLGIDFELYGCVGIHRVNALIDISGFAYTEQWGVKPTEDFANLAEFYRAQGKPVIMLPQAFGPFENEVMKSNFKRIIDNSSLIFPRDAISFEYVNKLSGDSEKIVQSPDITLFHPRKVVKENLNFDEYICLVPNFRMLDQGKDEWSEKYELYLLEIAKQALSQGLKVFVVVHDTTGQDYKLADRLVALLSAENIRLIDESNPYEIKKIIGGGKLVVGSRFHSLVASLSQGVPAIALGWSHKYEMLFEDFGLNDFIVSHKTSLDRVNLTIQKVLRTEENISLRKQISHKLLALEKENEKMWDSVVETLDRYTN